MILVSSKLKLDEGQSSNFCRAKIYYNIDILGILKKRIFVQNYTLNYFHLFVWFIECTIGSSQLECLHWHDLIAYPHFNIINGVLR